MGLFVHVGWTNRLHNEGGAALHSLVVNDRAEQNHGVDSFSSCIWVLGGGFRSASGTSIADDVRFSNGIWVGRFGLRCVVCHAKTQL